MPEQNDLELLLRSRTPIVVIETLEEPRIVQLFTRIGLRLGEPVFSWTVTEGLQRTEVDFGRLGFNTDPGDLLRHIKASAQPGLYLLLDFHPYSKDPLHVRLIKEIAQNHTETPKTLIFISCSFDIPLEVRHLSARFELKLPDRSAIKRLILEEAKAWQARAHKPISTDPRAVEQLASNLSGVTASDARRLVRAAIEDDGAIGHDDLPKVMKAKYDLINQEGLISFEYDTARFSDLAGLEHLKTWLESRRKLFHQGGGGLDRPKGIMLLGVQGGGKSLAAKAVAGSFGVPLLRLDFATLYNKYIGETEKNLRQALATAETMAPCVLWMDEIEKGIAPDHSDDGVSQRILGTLLTWMAENKRGVFVVATSNDIQRLPPELIRKGRLDEIFFVDLPGEASRREIFNIHLRRRNQAPSRFDLETLCQASEGFTGAEIEQAIVSALYGTHSRDEALTTAHLLHELEHTSPLSVVMAEKVSWLRAWASGRTVAAG
ncbi:MAG: AAA family ATPase [Gammaproteobacteria bacterium]|nr:AAA family ATPase [Gammaproteobacteria bacterium]